MDAKAICLFALNSTREFGASVASRLSIALAEHEEKEFEDGEHKARPLVSVRGKDVFVVQSLYADSRQSVNDKLCRLLFFAGALKDADAAHVVAAIPYLCYARQDNRSQAGEPVTTRYLASLFEAVGIDHVVAMDVHNLAAYQNAFRCRTDHLEARGLFVEHFASILQGEKVVTLSPDIGGIKRAEKFRAALGRRLEQPIAGGFMEKYRVAEGLAGERLIADVGGRCVIIVDDLISTGKTIARAAAACRAAGATRVYAAASHGLFAGNAGALLDSDAINQIIVTNSVPAFRLSPPLSEKVVVLDAASLFACAIERIHEGK
jgi:ribose-phosphate pyrophosphokinase